MVISRQKMKMREQGYMTLYQCEKIIQTNYLRRKYYEWW